MIDIEPCGWKYWTIMASYSLVLFMIFGVVFITTKYESTYHGDVGYEVSYSWNFWKFVHVIIISILAGMSTTAIGIGLAFL